MSWSKADWIPEYVRQAEMALKAQPGWFYVLLDVLGTLNGGDENLMEGMDLNATLEQAGQYFGQDFEGDRYLSCLVNLQVQLGLDKEGADLLAKLEKKGHLSSALNPTLAVLEFGAGQFGEAGQRIQRLGDDIPKDVCYIGAKCFERMNQPVSARAWYEKFLTARGGDSFFDQQAADAILSLCIQPYDLVASKESLSAYLAGCPNDLDVCLSLARALSLSGEDDDRRSARLLCWRILALSQDPILLDESRSLLASLERT
jgi:predicted Zn-dependent protease